MNPNTASDTPETDAQADDPYSIHLMNSRAERHDEAGRAKFGLTLIEHVVPADFSRSLEERLSAAMERLEKSASDLITCPWCKENDFDEFGLKLHISRGQCERYNSVSPDQIPSTRSANP